MFKKTLLGMLLSVASLTGHGAVSVAFLTPTASGGQASQSSNSTRLETDTKLYQAVYETDHWTGDIKVFSIVASGVSASVTETASTALDSLPASRKLISLGDSQNGIVFNHSTVTSTAAWSVSASAAAASVAASLGTPGSVSVSDLFDYWAGDGTITGTRDRGTPENPIGAIINSTPQFVGNVNMGYEALDTADVAGASSSPGDAYATFIRSTVSGASASRHAMLYVGANDGSLHGFDADDDLAEVFAYYPQTLWDRLASQADPSYGFEYLVDGSAKAGDAYHVDGGSEDWKTILIGTTGRGGTGVFALDVTDPQSSATAGTFAADTVLWEINEDSADFTDLGYTLPQSVIVLLENGHWAAIVANGYGSDSGKAVLYIVDLFDGSLIKAIDTGTTGNGLSTPIAVDTDGNLAADLIYAGDLKGNMWRFKLSHKTNTGQWSAQVLFAASDGAQSQLITAKPQVIAHPDGGQMVLFGTGKYFESGDEEIAADRASAVVLATSPNFNTFYGIWDQNDGSQPTNLVVQTLDYEGTLDGQLCGSPCIRVTSDNHVDYNSKRGWRLDFKNTTDSADDGFIERIISEPVVRNERVIFTTLIPNGTPYEGTGWLMEVDSLTGGRLDEIAFDLDNDGAFGDGDKAAYTDGGNQVSSIVSGVKSTVGLISTPNVISAASKEFKFNSGSSGEIQTTVESGGNGEAKGRRGWQQLQ